LGTNGLIFEMISDISKQIDSIKEYKKTFILHPEQWRTCQVQDLKWQFVKFDQQYIKDIPTERGLYSFIVKHLNNSFPNNGYVMYVGITGNVSNKRTLRSRYQEYLREINRPKRVHIHEMLNRWSDDLYFYFVPVPDKRVSLSKIETSLLDAMMPPLNENDFSGEFGKIVKAAWK